MGGKWNRWKNPISEVVDGVKVQRKEYTQWVGMTNRVKSNKHYDGVTVSDNFKDYDWYLDWAKQQKGFLNLEPCGRLWAIDKDILGDGTIYSEDICVFVPAEINNMFKASGSTLPIGVSTTKSRRSDYSVSAKYLGVRFALGTYNSLLKAHNVYLTFRKCIVDDLYRDYGDHIDNRVWEQLYKSCYLEYYNTDIYDL